jgi:hypothetical protein
MVLTALDTTGINGAAGAVTRAELTEEAGVELAGAEPVPLVLVLVGAPVEEREPELELEPAELAVDAAEPTVEVTGEVTGAAAEPTAEVTGDVTAPTAEVTGDGTDPTAADDVAPVDAVDVCVEVSGDNAAEAACAGRENSSMIAKIPAATSAACTATRAMRRTIGCSMSSSARRETGPPAYPPAAAENHAHPDLLFGHHRTAQSSIGQGREVPAKRGNAAIQSGRPISGKAPRHGSARAGRDIECVQLRP